jgi:hypothetical protein
MPSGQKGLGKIIRGSIVVDALRAKNILIVADISNSNMLYIIDILFIGLIITEIYKS